VTFGVGVKLNANTFTRAGYEFDGWHAYRSTQNQWLYTDGSASGWYAEGQQPEGYEKDIYIDQVTIARTTGLEGEVVVMYANWRANSYNITFLDEDGTVLRSDMMETGMLPHAPDPVKESDGVYAYTFAGWKPAITEVSGDATYTATYTAEVMPPAPLEPIAPVPGMLPPYLERVDAVDGLKEGVPYVISDYKDSWYHYMLTAEIAHKVDGSLTHTGLLLQGTPSTDGTSLWYIKDGKLVYGSPDSQHYLLISLDASGQGHVELGSYDEERAASLLYYTADEFAICSGTAYLNRHGGREIDVVATAYRSAGGSYWHLDQFVRGKVAAISLSAPETSVLMGKTVRLTPAVDIEGTTAENYTVEWSVDDSSVANVSSDGLVTALTPGTVNVTATLTAVNGYELLLPTTDVFTLTVPDHNYIPHVTAPTCTEKGYTTYTCTECGDSYTADEVEMLEHSYETVTVEATYR